MTYITIPGKDQYLEFDVWFLLNVYSFPTIVKSENCKFNQCKLRTICIYVINVGNTKEEVQIGKAEVRSSNWEGEMRDAKAAASHQ